MIWMLGSTLSVWSSGNPPTNAAWAAWSELMKQQIFAGALATNSLPAVRVLLGEADKEVG
jgi:hypothetical protein